jgi:predicted esterase YcpF (UPF0227 family)
MPKKLILNRKSVTKKEREYILSKKKDDIMSSQKYAKAWRKYMKTYILKEWI